MPPSGPAYGRISTYFSKRLVVLMQYFAAQASTLPDRHDSGQRARLSRANRSGTAQLWTRHVAVSRAPGPQNHQSPQLVPRRISRVGCEATRPSMHCQADPEIRFEYTTPRIRITPKDLEGTRLANAKTLHFICSPSRALAIMSEVEEGWKPITIYEPIPVCTAVPTL